ncbi:MAG: indole-3-glycerol phosphate synthase TrpC [Epulopiscium sp.]|nr:indole-3-glycerol phosphate synthase TrpC [Candidatus Epulonipiscium sp.]
MIFDSIVSHKEKQLRELLPQYNLEEQIQEAKKLPPGPNFTQSIQKSNFGIIGEIKKASPSKGIIKDNFNPVQLAKEYEGVVDAISILTEEKYFQGSPQYLKNVAQKTTIPLLQKDFVIHPYQIVEAKKNGASAVLLIVSILLEETLEKYLSLIKDLGLEALVEVHTKEELHKVLSFQNIWIGINNRDLKTFQVHLETTEKLMKYIPKERNVISESGIFTKEDVRRVKKAGVKGILVGESFMKSKNIKKLGEELRNGAD